MKHKFRITSSVLDDASLVLLVDDEIMTEAMAHEINKFWSSSEYRLQAQDGDIIAVVAKMFGERVFQYLSGEDGGYAYSSEECARYLSYVLRDIQEGWPDEEHLGITIMKIEFPSVTDYVEIEKL